ncbi:MAG: multiheme c-type cytochrome [Limisphaerales bacterium]
MSLARRFKTICAAVLFAAVFLLASVVGSLAWFHFGNPNNTCASCHEMTGVHSAWSASSHRTLHCRNCHGGSLTLDVHALRAHVNRVVQHFRRSPDQPIRLTEENVLALQEACRRCHPQSFADWQGSRHAASYAKIFLDSAQNRKEQLAPDCLRCHGMFYDGYIEDLVTPLSTTGPWALKDPAKAGQPVIPCLACHQVHTPAAGFKSAQLYVRHEKASFSADLLPITPITRDGRPVKISPDPRQRLCMQCHAPNAFRELGSADDRTPCGVHEGLSCLDCHSSHSNSAKASCAACHPSDSHCGLDVEKMDTTFLSAVSSHNIHTVACGDCHNGRRPAKRT